MNKWYDEDYEFEIEVIGVSHNGKAEGHCRNGDEAGDIYRCTYDCPVNSEGRGFCSKSMLLLFPMLETVRGGGDLRNIGGFSPAGNVYDSPYVKEFVCPDGVVTYRLTAKKTGAENFHRGGFYKE
ncbi:MAG: TIGR04076 family protein [Ruminococcus sp.]|nr:TIGR04076 family protein [Ruminococcus sp.]